MKAAEEEASSNDVQVLNLIPSVKQLHGVTSQDFNKLLKDSENLIINYRTETGLLLKLDLEKLAGFLPGHLASVLISSNRDESLFRYLLCGVRLLHSLCDLSSRNSKFEQIFLDDVKVTGQLIEIVFFLLTVLAGYRQEDHAFSHVHIMHSTLVACNFYLITGFISTQWRDIVHVLLAHPKVDIFIDAAFGSVRVVVRSLETTLVAYNKDISMESNLTAERRVYYLCQQCEASLQFLQSLCQQKMFKERLLKNKELCGKGGILLLAQSILKLHIQPHASNRIMAAISRLKAKILSILLSLCEAENISYLDEVASTTKSLELSKSVALEVFDLLKKDFGRNPGKLTADRSHPMGFVQLNAMRLADIFSDDSNFRSYMILCFTEVLTAIISLPHGDFLSCWCSSNLSDTEEDASLEYDIFAAVGWVLHNTSPDVKEATDLEFNLTPNSMLKASYAHHRTSLFIKFFANLHCFVPNVCEEQERNLFVLKVLECLNMDLSNLLPEFSFDSDAPRAATASRNLRSLLSHAESLIPNFLNVEDIQLLRVFFGELQSRFTSNGSGRNRAQQKTQDSKFEKSSWDKFSKLNINEWYQEAQSAGGRPLPLTGRQPADLDKKGGKIKEGMSENSSYPNLEQHNTKAEDKIQGNGVNRQSHVENKGISGKTASGGVRDTDKDAHKIETSGSDASSAKGKNVAVHMDKGELSKSNERHKKVAVEENPEDEKIELTQRKKRKRTIMNEEQVLTIERALLDEPDMQRNAALLQSWADKLSSNGSEVTSSQLKNWLNNRKARLARTAKDVRPVTADLDNPVSDRQKEAALGSHESPISQGQYVMLIGQQGEEIGKGKVFQLEGEWYGKALDANALHGFGVCVVDVCELRVDKGLQLPYTSEAVGSTFAEAQTKFGVMRVIWPRKMMALRSD
ncbi:unnamed protein product [Lathyrus oleraceus]|uniref:Homeobox domain-containing protein n=2 Tax=Pisum sativum TaxID=3888 RepID=A0A9D5APD1_PEA|nr:nodulin homeobox isoform X1 [Pisum sativum]KAI5413345.1 hypothetical protein KIW84_057806 [Pisum sativum]